MNGKNVDKFVQKKEATLLGSVIYGIATRLGLKAALAEVVESLRMVSCYLF